MPTNERRKHKRIDVAIPVRLRIGDRSKIPGDMEDISLGGAFIRCPVTVPVGATIDIEIHFSGMQLIAGKVVNLGKIPVPVPEHPNEEAIVRWTTASNSFGVEFLNLTEETRRFLVELVAYFEKHSKA